MRDTIMQIWEEWNRANIKHSEKLTYLELGLIKTLVGWSTAIVAVFPTINSSITPLSTIGLYLIISNIIIGILVYQYEIKNTLNSLDIDRKQKSKDFASLLKLSYTNDNHELLREKLETLLSKEGRSYCYGDTIDSLKTLQLILFLAGLFLVFRGTL